MDIVTLADESGDFVTETSGYVVWWPTGSGYYDANSLRALADELDRHRDLLFQHPFVLDAQDLRALADELDRRNAAWDAQIAKDIGGGA